MVPCVMEGKSYPAWPNTTTCLRFQHGSYVCVHIAGVPKDFVGKNLSVLYSFPRHGNVVLFSERLNPFSPLIIYGLLHHEQKMTLLNMVIRKHQSCNVSIKSKERLLFQVGYRRFWAAPIFSQHATGDKHKVSFGVLAVLPS